MPNQYHLESKNTSVVKALEKMSESLKSDLEKEIKSDIEAQIKSLQQEIKDLKINLGSIKSTYLKTWQWILTLIIGAFLGYFLTLTAEQLHLSNKVTSNHDALQQLEKSNKIFNKDHDYIEQIIGVNKYQHKK